jgi:transposase-like protein
VLHALKPIGQGTADVESLLSYICRLSVSHSTSTLSLSRTVAELVKHEISAAYDWHERQFSGIGESAVTWSAALSALTTVGGLDSLTFLPWRNTIAKNGFSTVTRGQFCPACFEEDRMAGRIPYFRLAWESAAVTVCHRHKTRLSQVCPSCNHENVRHKSAFVVPGWCTRCGEFLGKQATKPSTVVILEPSAIWRAREVAALLASQQSLAIPPTRASLLEAIEKIITTMDGGQSAAFARRVGIAKSTVHSWLKGPGTPSLDISLNIALQCGISLPKLLTGDMVGWQPPVAAQQFALKLMSPQKEPGVAPRELNWEDIEKQLAAFLLLPTPITVLDAAQQLGVEARQLYLRVNRTTRMVGERWLDYSRRRQVENIQQAWPHLEAACREIHAQGKAVTKRDIVRRVPASVLSKVPHLLDVLKDVQAQMSLLEENPA